MEKERPQVIGAVLRFHENHLNAELQINPKGANEIVCLSRAITIPETIVSALPGRKLTGLIQGSRMIDEIIGNRAILDCYHQSPKLGLIRVEIADARPGWWFER